MARVTHFSSRTPLMAAVIGTVAALVVSGCSDSTTDPNANVTNASKDVFYTACTESTCEGELDGSPFKIEMPRRWNGSLLLYSHEARGETSVTPFEASTAAAQEAGASPQLAPTWTLGTADLKASLLEAGYGLAGASVPAKGWRVDQQIAAADAVYTQFNENVATPNRVYTWGPSNGALTSVYLAEQRDWVSGAFGMCGTLAGITRNYDVALDAAFAVKRLLYPNMKLANYASAAEAQATYKEAMKRVRKAAADKFGEGAIQLAVIGPVGEIPPKTSTNGGAGISGQAAAIAEGLGVVLARSTVERFAVEQEMGGNISSNEGTDYFARVTVAERDKIDEKEPGATQKYLTKISKGKRIGASAQARGKANASPKPNGSTRVPTVTLHTEFDPVAIVENEGALVTAANQTSTEARRLLSPNIVGPPAFYPQEGQPVAGAGHCSFTTESVFGSVELLNRWVREGLFPSDAKTAELLGPDSGLRPNFPLLKWPAGPTIG